MSAGRHSGKLRYDTGIAIRYSTGRGWGIRASPSMHHVHVDQSAVTLNVTLDDGFTGGDLLVAGCGWGPAGAKYRSALLSFGPIRFEGAHLTPLELFTN